MGLEANFPRAPRRPDPSRPLPRGIEGPFFVTVSGRRDGPSVAPCPATTGRRCAAACRDPPLPPVDAVADPVLGCCEQVFKFTILGMAESGKTAFATQLVCNAAPVVYEHTATVSSLCCEMRKPLDDDDEDSPIPPRYGLELQDSPGEVRWPRPTTHCPFPSPRPLPPPPWRAARAS